MLWCKSKHSAKLPHTLCRPPQGHSHSSLQFCHFCLHLYFYTSPLSAFIFPRLSWSPSPCRRPPSPPPARAPMPRTREPQLPPARPPRLASLAWDPSEWVSIFSPETAWVGERITRKTSAFADLFWFFLVQFKAQRCFQLIYILSMLCSCLQHAHHVLLQSLFISI